MDKFPIFNLQFSIYWLLEFGYWSLVIGSFYSAFPFNTSPSNPNEVIKKDPP